MNRKHFIYLNLLITIILISFLSCSDKNNEVEDEKKLSFKMIDSYPVDNADDISPENLSAVITYDRQLTLSSDANNKVSINDAEIKDIKTDERNLLISISGLKEAKKYNLILKEGLVSFDDGRYSESESLNFTTSENKELISVCDQNATSETLKLFTWLKSVYGSKTLSASMANVNWNCIEAERVFKLTGKYPAINCFDFIHIQYSPADWINYDDITPVKEWHQKGGITKMMWHVMVPVDENSEDYTYEPTKTTFRGSNIFIDNTWEKIFFFTQLDKICNTLLKLQEEKIPVLWRPFHEASGNYYNGGDAWFWWGYEGPEVYVKLWKLVFNYLNEKGVHNLIWIWTTENTGDVAYYPGDDFADIIGRDLYGYNATQNFDEWSSVSSSFSDKMIALSECGNKVNGRTILRTQSTIPEQWGKGCRWLFFMPWYDYDYNMGNAGVNVMCNDSFWESAMSRTYVMDRETVKNQLKY